MEDVHIENIKGVTEMSTYIVVSYLLFSPFFGVIVGKILSYQN